MNRNEVNRAELSPMMKQYMEIKDNYQEELLFFRLGDFYELFFEDGIIASRELELTLTGKNAGLKERIPMCGVPFHSVNPYLEKLVEKGYKVAICEQLEDAKNVKGTVKRGVVEVISKGTVINLESLNEHDNNYIASILDLEYLYLITYADISTGELNSLNVEHNKEKLINEILHLNIKEVLLENNLDSELINILKNNYGIEISISDEYLVSGYETLIENIEDVRVKQGVRHLLHYLVIKELKDLSHVSNVNIINKNNYLEMDIHTVRNLELVETLRLKERTYSLLWLLDKTKTAMGSRKLKAWLLNPLRDINELNNRYDKLEVLNNEFLLKDELRNLLFEIYDIERLCAKVICGNLNARDLLQIKNSLSVLPRIKNIISELGFSYKINTHTEIFNLLENSIYENPPLSIKEGYLIKDGYNKELDELKSVRTGGKDFISKFESEIKESTGIKNLKVGFNRVFGYYIEISKGQAQYVSEDLGWERRQTLANCERFISPELKEKESLILNAEEKIFELEYNLFCEIREIIKNKVLSLKETAEIISELDVLCSLAVCSEEYNLVKPNLNLENKIEIIDGRHPVVECVSKNMYVPNDIIMDNSTDILLITGPNMSGKSTYMRELAIIVIMAQMGSFVPAKSANLPIIDKIFTRIGASDDLVSGESTFMVEMKEARNALVNATSNSLILFDELGRGTATFDGMSLAQAILEYVAKNIKCKTLFSTHYHELTRLESEFLNVKNVHVAAKEEGNMITFLHKVKNGPADKSYGIHVARLAKMPDDLLERAEAILSKYENESKKTLKTDDNIQLALNFEEPKDNTDELREKLKAIDPLHMTPIEAINILFELKELE
ncbi:MAG: DNA mismatch repair protein MutS [Firmicutes bacterium]|nr:DNA mismatch repair protein MutS [Bacillota bacterium]